MTDTIHIYWPGDYRPTPNQLALPMVEESTQQLERALDRLGRKHARVPGLLTRPHESIERLGPIDEPLVGVYAHWVYGPHTTDGVVGKDSPLLLTSNFSGTWPGLVGLLNTAACLESVDRRASRVWTDATDWSRDEVFMSHLASWCETGVVRHATHAVRPTPVVPPAAAALAAQVHDEFLRRRALVLMLGDTSMGMINGYFGPRTLNKVGFTEHKVDQAWIIERGRQVAERRIEDAFEFVRSQGRDVPLRRDGRRGLRRACHARAAARLPRGARPGRGVPRRLCRLAVPTRPDPFAAAVATSAKGLLNSACRPESNGDTLIDATEADQGNLLPMEMMKRLLKAKGLHQAVIFHDVRWGAEHDGRFLWVLLNSGSCGAYAFNHDPDTLRGVHSYRQPAAYFPIPGGTFAGESLPGKITWARAYLAGGQLWMDLGRGDSRTAAADNSRRLVERHHAAVAVHGGRPRHRPRHADGPLSQQPHRRCLRGRLR